jgi:hypothetical protein
MTGQTRPAPGATPSREDTETTSTRAPVDVFVGSYVVRIPSLSFRDNQWTVDAYVWFRWSGDLNPPPQESFALCNATIEKKEVTDSKKVRLKSGNKEQEFDYACVRIQATVTSFWDISRYPFDEHALCLVVEDNREFARVRYRVDHDACVLDGMCKMPGWDMGAPRVQSVAHTYPTNYGDPEFSNDRESSFASLHIDIPLTRANRLLYSFKVFNGLYLSVAIALLAFFVKPQRVDVRFGTGVGAVFAAIASQYVITSSLPDTGQLTLVDELYGLGTGIIFLSVLESAAALYLFETGRHHAARFLDQVSFVLLAAGYFIANLWLIRA